MKEKFLAFVSSYFLLFILFFPVVIGSFQFQKWITTFLFGNISDLLGKFLLGRNIRSDFSSDSFSMVLLMLILGLFAILISFLIKKRPLIKLFAQKIIPYYIAIILLKYGADKLFKAQFYLPEPNILFTKFGDLDQDILFWSVMGTSRTYSLILGTIEVLISILLIFKKTRILGSILAFFTFANILIINFSFDISVKFFSITLFLMTIFSLGNFWSNFYHLIIKKQIVQIQTSEIQLNEKLKSFLFPLKILIIGLAFLQIFLPIYQSKNWNDDLAERPFLHGAYQIKFDPNPQKDQLKYLFFHRAGYLIFVNENDDSKEYIYQVDLADQVLKCNSFQGENLKFKYKYSKKDSILSLRTETDSIILKSINWRKMAALKPQFHWIIEEL